MPIFASSSYREPLQQQQQQQQQQVPAASPPRPVLSSNHTATAPTAASEVGRLTPEYDREASRMAEQLELCGIRRESLSSRARLDLQLIASLASALHLAQAGPQLVLAAWAALALQQSKAVALKFKLQQGVETFVRERQAAQAKLKVLQQVLHDVQAKQKVQALAAQEKAKQIAPLQEKASEYMRHTLKLQKKLNNNGFKHEVTHAALLAKHQGVEELRQQLAELQAELDSYHHLPASQLGADMMLQQEQARLKEKQAKLQSCLADM